MLECTEHDRTRIFNLGYYTWVEQQGTPLDVFEARRSQSFWRGLRRYLPRLGRADRRLQRAGRGRVVSAAPTVRRLPLRGLRHGGRRRRRRSPWRCPNATDADRHHVLQIVRRPGPFETADDPNPFVAFGA